ncbi:MAG TPA: nuclear transport factor 2 family protein [Amycolatopsis sp.]|uniref:nuclear transport factor 2 family protein n=1 Tax=Amycolatopsis sp. TaxID=37632 RepID=UPI002F3FD1FF
MSQQSREIVQNAWNAFASHDANRISAVFTEDAEWLAPPGDATAVALESSSHMVGRKAIMRPLQVTADGYSRRR